MWGGIEVPYNNAAALQTFYQFGNFAYFPLLTSGVGGTAQMGSNNIEVLPFSAQGPANKTQAIATKPRDRSVQCTLGAIPETQPTKKGVSFAGHLKSGGGAKSDGKSTAVDPSPAMSPPKEIANSYEPLYKVLAVSADRKATSIKQKGDASNEV